MLFYFFVIKNSTFSVVHLAAGFRILNFAFQHSVQCLGKLPAKFFGRDTPAKFVWVIFLFGLGVTVDLQEIDFLDRAIEGHMGRVNLTQTRADNFSYLLN